MVGHMSAASASKRIPSMRVTVNVAVRRFLSISAVVAVLASVSIAAVCGYDVGSLWSESLQVQGPRYAVALAVASALLALLKPAVALLMAAFPLTSTTAVGVGVFWLALLLYNWSLATYLLVACCSGSTVTAEIVGLSMVVLAIEIVSGYLPALAYLARSAGDDLETGAPCGAGAVGSTPAATPSVAEPAQAVRTFEDLFRHVKGYGCAAFPGLRRDAEGALVASQRTFADIFGVTSGTINGRIWKEHHAGRIVASANKRETRIALPR